tara:strand:+ start:2113 stop:2496 length:384 start_codon:yes stop_codon:yes gene_type:complete
MWGMLLKPLISTVGEVVKNLSETRKAKVEQKVTKIKAETDLMKRRIAGELQYDIQAVKSGDNSFKDEAWTILFIIIIGMCFVPPLQPYVERGLDALGRTPDWLQYSIYGSIASSFGLRGMGKILGKK